MLTLTSCDVAGALTVTVSRVAGPGASPAYRDIAPIIFNRAIHSLADDGQIKVSTVQTTKGPSACYSRVVESDDDTELVATVEVPAQAPVKAELIRDCAGSGTELCSRARVRKSLLLAGESRMS